MNFYSVRLLFIILVDDGKPKKRNEYNEIVVVFRADDWNDALDRAFAVGRSKETEYENKAGQTVRWALVDVVSLDLVGRKVDGAEVASRMFQKVSKEPIEPTTTFRPEESTPPQSF